MTEQGTARAAADTQDPEDLQVETTDQAASDGGLSDRHREVLFRVLRVAYPHDRFPDGPYQRTAATVEAAATAGADDLAATTAGLGALDADGFLDLDEAAATAALEAVDTEPFFRLIHSTTVVALYDDREVWTLLGYEGAAYDQGGYLNRGFDDLDWLPDPRITEYEGEARLEIVTEGAP